MVRRILAEAIADDHKSLAHWVLRIQQGNAMRIDSRLQASTHRIFLRMALSLLAITAPTAICMAATTIDLSSEASRSASNDLGRATVFSESHGNNPGEVSRYVNGQIAAALKLAHAYPSVKTQSGNSSTYPTYGKTNKIEGWQMRSEIVLESSDTAALSELLGKLQNNALGVSGLLFLPAAETRKKAENEALLDALAAFKNRAKLVAEALGGSYRIKQLSLGGYRRPITPLARGNTFAAEAAVAMPVESGESQISITVSGQIELSD
jgi:predicted secreted protein